MRLARLLSIIFTLSFCGDAIATAPELHRIDPPGGARGTEFDLTLRGLRLADSQEVLFYQPGIEVLSLSSPDANVAVAKVRIAPDCPLGEFPLRVRTASGISDVRTIRVGALPVVNELEPNNDFASPQLTELDRTVFGVVTNEDVDYYAVTAKAGQRISAEVEAIRLGETMFDAYVAILDARRFELDACDDSALGLQDPIASVIAPEDGTYVVQVREAAYGGSDACRYRLHIGTFPRPRVTYPIGGQPGAELQVRHLGDAAGEKAESIKLPDTIIDRWPYFPKDESGVAPSPTWLRVSMHANVVEPQEGEASIAPIDPPVAFNGILEKSGEEDRFRFIGKKDHEYDVRIFARSHRSPVDAVVNVFQGDGKHITGNDDSQRGVDSEFRFRAPADGEYEVRIRDHLGRGGSTFVYRIEINSPQPSLAMTIEKFNSRAHQYRQAIPVPKGNRTAALLRVQRKDVGGEISVETEIPAGVNSDASPIMHDVQHVPMVFSAAADAPVAGGLYPLRGKISREQGGDLVGEFAQTMPLVVSDPNEAVYYELELDRVAIAVTEPAPFKVELHAPEVPLVQAGRHQLRMTVVRNEGYEEAIEARMLWKPPGISCPDAVSIPKDVSEATYDISAAGDAPVRVWPMVVIAKGAQDGGEWWVSSAKVDLTVTEPFVSGNIHMIAAEQGQTTALMCELKQLKPFEGAAVIRLYNLPPNTKTTERQFTAQDAQVAFDIEVAKDAPAGTHKNLFCEAVVTQNGQPITHRLAFGGTLRIDVPRVVEATPAATPAPTPKPEEPPKPPPEKPLSRLEQLRKAAADRTKTEGESDAAKKSAAATESK